MKILLVHNFYRINGGECHAVRAQQALLERHGHQVVTFYRDSRDIAEASLLGKALAATRVRGNHAAMRELEALVTRERPDLAHVHNVFPIISPLVYPRLHGLGIPVVQSVHNLRLRCPGGLMFREGEVCDACLTGGLRKAVMNRCVQNSPLNSLLYADALSNAWRNEYFTRAVDRYIVFNEFFARQLRAAGIPDRCVSLLPNFVAIPHEYPHQEMEAKQPYALYLGRLSAEKGIGTLLDAWRSVNGLTLKIAGSGDLATEVQRRCASDLAGKAEFMGYVQGETKSRLLRQASLSLLPSECHENCPLSLLESLAAGTPVLVTRMGGLPDMVRHGQTGFVIEPGDADALAAAVRTLVDDPARVEVMGRAALAVAKEKYAADVHYEGLMDIYRGAITERHQVAVPRGVAVHAG